VHYETTEKRKIFPITHCVQTTDRLRARVKLFQPGWAGKSKSRNCFSNCPNSDEAERSINPLHQSETEIWSVSVNIMSSIGQVSVGHL